MPPRKQASDAPTIGLILCQTKDHLFAEYSFSGIDKPIGISTYELTRALPTVEEIEAELATRAPRSVKQAGRARKK